MAKLKGPLFSVDAHGTLAGALTYSKRKIVKQVRFQKKQKDSVSVDRATNRTYFQEGIADWHTLTSGQQQEWNDFIKS